MTLRLVSKQNQIKPRGKKAILRNIQLLKLVFATLCMLESMHVGAQAYTQRSNFSRWSGTYLLGLQAPKIFLFLPSLHRDCKQPRVRLVFYVGAKDLGPPTCVASTLLTKLCPFLLCYTLFAHRKPTEKLCKGGAPSTHPAVHGITASTGAQHTQA